MIGPKFFGGGDSMGRGRGGGGGSGRGSDRGDRPDRGDRGDRGERGDRGDRGGPPGAGDRNYEKINDFSAVSITLASPNDIRSWSYGEVKKPETINYRSYRAEKDGLFCERIFGPERDWECSCGKYKGIKYKDIICDRCGVKVTHSRVRRKRMGHINLAAPIVHIWFFKALPTRLGALLDMKTSDIEKIVYFQDYVVTDPGKTPLKKKQLLTEDEYRAAYEKYADNFTAEMGADAIKKLLGQLDLQTEQ